MIHVLCMAIAILVGLHTHTHTQRDTHTHTQYTNTCTCTVCLKDENANTLILHTCSYINYGAYTQPLHTHSTVNQVNKGHDQLEQYHYYDTMYPSTGLSPSTNKASGISASTGEDPYYSAVTVHANDPKILTSHGGDIPTSTITYDEPDYYVNEGLNDPRSSMIENEAYGDIPTCTSTIIYDEPDYYINEGLNDPHSSMIENEAYGDIPTSITRNDEQVNERSNNPRMTTTQNEAYGDLLVPWTPPQYQPREMRRTLVYPCTNTERMDTEETYNYVSNL